MSSDPCSPLLFPEEVWVAQPAKLCSRQGDGGWGGREGRLWSPDSQLYLSQGTSRRTISYLKLTSVKPVVPTPSCTLELPRELGKRPLKMLVRGLGGGQALAIFKSSQVIMLSS